MSYRNRPVPRLTVTKIKEYLEIGVPPREELPFMGRIGTMFHRTVERVYHAIQQDSGLVGAIANAQHNEAHQPLIELIYHKVLPGLDFESLPDDSQEALWLAIKLFAQDFGRILSQARSSHSPEDLAASVILASEEELCWNLEIDGTRLEVVGRLDMIVQDPRYGAPVLLEFKLSGVRKDLANLCQVMLYALMLHRTRGVKPSAKVVNLYPIREPVAVSWEQIERFEPALVAFVRKVASNEFPDIVEPPNWAPLSRQNLETAEPPPDQPKGTVTSCSAATEEKERRSHSSEMTSLVALLREFGLEVEPVNQLKGPRTIRLNILTTGTTRVRSVESLQKDIQVRLNTKPLVTVSPGHISVEMPRSDVAVVKLADILKPGSDPRMEARFPLGVGIDWKPVWANLADHSTCQWLLAGSPGSGKSEFLRCIITSLGYGATDKQIVFSLIDPKGGVAFRPFEGWSCVKHLVTSPQDSVHILEELCAEMERRYAQLNDVPADHLQEWAETSPTAPPRWVVVFDEYNEFMSNTDFRAAILNAMTRIGQMGRACGIHVLLATQHPSAQVCPTELRNMLVTRVAFRAVDRTQSQVVLDSPGAENLLGKGDLLFKSPDTFIRLQAPFVKREEIVSLLKIERS